MSEDLSLLEPEEIQTRIDELTTDPYYMTDKPKDLPANIQKHNNIVEKTRLLFEAKHPSVKEKILDSEGNDITPAGRPLFEGEAAKEVAEYMADKEAKTEAEKQALETELQQEIDMLSEVNPDVDYSESFDGKDYREKIEAYRSIRYLNDDNLEYAKPLIMQTANEALKATGNTVEGRARVELLQNYLETVTNDPADIDFLADIVKQIYDARIGEN